MKKKAFFILAAVLMMAGCQNKDGEVLADQNGFETMTVSKQNITLEQSYLAQIEGRQSIKIIPRVEGYLRQICVKEGQRVKKGQVLFVIDQASYLAEVKAAEANVAVAKAGVETAQLNYDSRKTLYQKNVVSNYDLRTATANLAMAKAQGYPEEVSETFIKIANQEAVHAGFYATLNGKYNADGRLQRTLQPERKRERSKSASLPRHSGLQA